MSSNMIRGGLAASCLLLAVVVAQDAPRERAAGQRNADRANADAPNADAPNAEGAAALDPASMKPVDHFLAGYYAGYADGYLDGGEDAASAAAQWNAALAAKHAADGQHDQMQPGRRQARESLRAHMRGEEDAQPAEGQAAAGQKADGQAAPGREETLSGTVIGVKSVPIEGTQIVHRVVRLETEDGRRQVADLGPTDQTDKLEVKEGDQLRVQGVPVQTPDMRIIAGHRIFKGDQEAHVHYPGLKVSDDPAGTGAPDAPQGRRPR